MIFVAGCGHLVGALCKSVSHTTWCPICKRWEPIASVVVGKWEVGVQIGDSICVPPKPA